jgi:hypothetical protein
LQPEAGLIRKDGMRRLAPAFAALVLAPLLGGAATPGTTPAELETEGWRKVEWSGIRPAEFSRTPSRGVRIQGQGQGSFIAGAGAWMRGRHRPI